MRDIAHEWTDDEIGKLQRRFDKSYGQAAKEMRKKLNDYLSQYGEANDQWRDMLKSGDVTDEQYKAWLRSQSLRRDYLVDMCDTLARDASRTNRLATEMINDELPRVYAENANYAAYGIESHLRANTHAFDLVDQSTVRRFMGMSDDGQVIKEVTTDKGIVSPPLVTMRKINFDEAKDVRWNRQKFNAALTQSILQGESIPNTAKRMAGVLNMGRNMAVRAARTAMTSAENAGRVDSYQRAKRLGIDLEQEWLATLDERTRHTHRELDGQHVPIGGKFKVPSSGHELEFPGDPTAHPSEVWNCRCTLVAWFPEDGEESAKGRFSRLPKGVTYEDWKAGIKADDKKAKSSTPSTLEGFKDYEKRYVESNRASYRLDDEQMEHLKSMVGKMFDESEVYAYVSGDAIQDVVRGGHLMNILELSTDEAYNAERRALAEQLFGIDASKLSAGEFEKYGFLGSKNAEKVLRSGTNAQIYGDICVRFRKDKIKDRTTYTFGDSFNEVQRGSDIIAGGLSDRLSVSGIQPSEARRTYAAMSKLEESGGLDATDVTQRTVGKYGYIETQLHGKLDSEEIEVAFVKCRRENGEWVPKDGGSELLDLLGLAKFDVVLVDENGRIIRKLGE